MEDNERILRLIETLMKKRGISCYRLAVDSGIPKSTLSTMFGRRSTVSVENLRRICGALGISRERFFQILDRRRTDPMQTAPAGDTDFPLLEWELLTPDHRRILREMMLLLSMADGASADSAAKNS